MPDQDTETRCPFCGAVDCDDDHTRDSDTYVGYHEEHSGSKPG